VGSQKGELNIMRDEAQGIETRLRGMAREAIELADGDWHSASEILLGNVEREFDEKDRRRMHDCLLFKGSSEIVQEEGRSSRRRPCMEKAPSPPNSEDTSLFKAVVDRSARESKQRDYLRYQIKGGLHLGKATYAQIVEQREIHAALERGNALRRRWFAMVADAMEDHPDKMVEDVLTSDQLGQMYEEAKS